MFLDNARNMKVIKQARQRPFQRPVVDVTIANILCW